MRRTHARRSAFTFCILPAARLHSTEGRFDPYEHLFEAGRPHQGEQFVVFRQVDRRLGEQGEGVAPAAHPIGDPGEQRLDGLPVPDEVVVHDEHGPTPPHAVELFELRKDLIRCLGAGVSPEELDDVAKLAGKRAPPGVLDGHRAVPSQSREAKIGGWDPGHVRPAGGFVPTARLARFKVGSKLFDDPFRFAPDDVVRTLVRWVGGARDRSAHHGPQPRFPASCDQLRKGRPLDQHGAQERHVGPGDVLVAELFHVEVHQFPFPARREHRRNGEQSQGRIGGPFPDEREGMAKTPKRIGEFGIEQQDLHV